MFNESLGAQNKLLMDIMHKRASAKGVLTPDKNAGMNDRTDYTASRKASRNSGLNSPVGHNTTLEFETPIKRSTSKI